MMWHMDLRRRIQAEIDKRIDMTIRSLSLKAGLSDSALNKFMTGRTQSLTIGNVEKLAEALGITLRELLFGESSRIVGLFDRIPDHKKDQATRVLETFTDDPEQR